MRSVWVSLACLFALALPAVQSLFFLVADTPQCFTLEQPRDTPMSFQYNVLVGGGELTGGRPALYLDLYYGRKPHPDLQIFHRPLVNGVGHVDFIADNDGFYTYCVLHAGADPDDGLPSVSGSGAPDALESTSGLPIAHVSLHVEYGFDEEHYARLVKEHSFDEVNLQVHRLNDMLTMALNEADYQKHKEIEYHSRAEKMNKAAIIWPILQISILVFTGIFQVRQLKKFFKSNKFI